MLVKISQAAIFGNMGKAEISEHMYVCLCTYMSMYICISNHIFILRIILPPSSAFGRYLKYGTCARWAGSKYYFIMINSHVCVSLNKPTSNLFILQLKKSPMNNFYFFVCIHYLLFHEDKDHLL